MIVQIFDGETPYGFITTVLPGAKQTTPLDRVGSFAFSCSASDPQAAQLVAGRQVFGYERGVLRISGIIEDIKEASTDGVPVLAVSGPDLTKELADCYIARLALSEEGKATAVGVSSVVIDPDTGSGSDAILLTESFDGNMSTPTTGYDFTNNDRWLYIGGAVPFTEMYFTCAILSGGYGGGTWGDGNPMGPSFQYFDGTDWVAAAMTADTTQVDGDSFAQEGYMTFTLSGGPMKQTTEHGVSAYFVRGRFNAAADRIALYEVQTKGLVPTDNALALVAAQFPTTGNGYAGTWTLDTVTGLSATVKTDVYDTLTRVSVYDALLKLTELTGEHFYCTPDRKVVWIGNTNAVAMGPASTGTGSLDLQIAATADDGVGYSTFFMDNVIIVGRAFGDTQRYWPFLRFAGAAIPSGVTITEATLRLKALNDDASLPTLTVYGNDADNAVAPTNMTERLALAPTTAGVNWSCPMVTHDQWYDLPDLSAIIQEIADRPGWQSGNAVQLLIDDDNSPNFNATAFTDRGIYPENGAQLHIEYTYGHPGQPIIITVPSVPLLAEDNASIALLSKLTIQHNSREAVTRAYPVGAGLGDGSLDLTYATMTMPAGFVMNTTDSYIRLNPEGVRRDGRPDFKDISPVTPDQRARENAADALAAATLVWLGRHSAANVSYDVECVNLSAGVVKPGMMVWLKYNQYVDGQLVMSVDDDSLIVLEITDTITESAAVTTGLKVSTLAAWPISNDEYLRRMLRNQRAMGASPQAVGVSDVRTSDFAVSGMALTTGGGGLAYGGSSAASGSVSGGMAAHALTGGYHTATGLTEGQVLRAESATSFTFAALEAGDLPSHDVVSAHSASGLTPGHVLTATGADAFGFAAPATPALGSHDHSGDAGDGGTFDAANLTSGAATDGQVLTADGSGGAAWEDPAGGTVDAGDVTYTPATAADWDSSADPGDVDDALDQLAERVADLESAGSPSVATDAIWDAAGDLAVGTGANTAGRLAIGNTGEVLTVVGGTASWQSVGLVPGTGADPTLAIMDLLGWA